MGSTKEPLQVRLRKRWQPQKRMAPFAIFLAVLLCELPKMKLHTNRDSGSSAAIFSLRGSSLRRMAEDPHKTETEDHSGHVESHGDGHGNSTAHDAHHGSAHEEHEHHSGAFTPVVFFLVAYTASCVSQTISDFAPEKFRPPHTVALFIIGMLFSAMAPPMQKANVLPEFATAILDFQTVDPHVIFWILLPPLLYEDAGGVHWHVVKRVLPSSLLLALPGVMINALLTGAIIKGTFTTISWEWPPALLLGSILSATDPVAVVGALHALHAPEKLSSIISGESLLNDGSAVVLFFLFWDICRKIIEFDFGYAVGFFIQLAVGGPLLGFAMALVLFIWLKKTHNFQIEIIAVMIVMYGAFFISEHHSVGVSGVLAVVVFGFFMAAHGHMALAKDKEHEHHTIIGFVALLCNEAIFVIGGVVGERYCFSMSSITGSDWGELFFLYFVIHFTRALVIAIFWPFLSKWGYGVRWKEAVIMVFGGLRGAVGLAMALLVESDPRMDEEYRSRIAFHVSGIVLLTLLVNGTTVTTLYQKLKLYKHSSHHHTLLKRAVAQAEAVAQEHIMEIKKHWFFHSCHWDTIKPLVPELAAPKDPHHKAHKDPNASDHKEKEEVKKEAPEVTVHRVIMELAKLCAQVDLPAQWMEKLKYAMKKEGSFGGQNIFLKADLTYSADNEKAEVEVEEAMDIIRNEQDLFGEQALQEGLKKEEEEFIEKQRKFSANGGLPGPTSSNGVEEIDGKNDTEYAEYGEKPIKDSVLRSFTKSECKQGYNSLCETLDSEDAIAKMKSEMERWEVAKLKLLRLGKILEEHKKIRHSKLKQGMGHLGNGITAKARKKLMTSVEDMRDIYFTVLDAVKAQYTEMNESRMLKEYPHRLLMDTLEYAEEAVNGDLRQYEFLKNSSDPEMQQAHTLPPEKQMQVCFKVAWECLKDHIGKPISMHDQIMQFVTCGKGKKMSISMTWTLLKRDVEALLAFVLVHEHVMEEVGIIEDFAELHNDIKSMTHVAQNHALYQLCSEWPGMFNFFEHLLCARLMIVTKIRVLKHFQKEGIISSEDFHAVVSHSLKPAMHALHIFVPTLDQLNEAGKSDTSNFSTDTAKAAAFMATMNPFLAPARDALGQAAMLSRVGSKMRQKTGGTV